MKAIFKYVSLITLYDRSGYMDISK